MSSSPTARSSTSGSWTSSPSPADPGPAHRAGTRPGTGPDAGLDAGPDAGPDAGLDPGRDTLRNPDASAALIACGALAQPAARIVRERGWPVDVHPLPPLLHNRPEKIAGEVEQLAIRLRDSYAVVAVGYADCGTYGALDEVCDRLALQRLDGLHCYDIYAGADRMEKMFADQAGTYVLTDFLVRSFARTVEVELGLDRWPALREEYFRHYTRVVWLAQELTPELRTAAQEAAARIGLPLTVVPTGTSGLEHALEGLVGVAS